jgi:CubicO group peptidase (beta-lactamase class C family)
VRKRTVWIIGLIILLIFLSTGCEKPEAKSVEAQWPTRGWLTSTPEEQGMDSGKLADLFDRIESRKLNLHSLLVVRNGYLVTEAYYFPYGPETLQSLYSCTKSVVSALVGIAIDKGFIRGVDQPLLSFFPDRTVAHADPRKQAITLENVLTMSSGLDWPEWGDSITSPTNINMQMLRSPDAVQFVLDRPMQAEPGTVFNYNTGGSNLLSAILERTTGTSTLEFARTRLFDPLGISDVFWSRTRSGTYRGGDGLMLTARDLAKFGYLYLNRGFWDGDPIVPAAWVDASTKDHISTGKQAFAGYQYGYQWWLGWIQSPGFYAASGYGGQFIFVVPEKNLVVVFTGELPNTGYDDQFPKALAETYILSAVRSDDPLPADPEAAGRLEARIRSASQPHPRPVPALPAAAQVSGRTYLFDANEQGIQSFSLVFSEGADEAHLIWKVHDRTMDFLVGLDDVFRLTKIGLPDSIALAMGEGFYIEQPEHLELIPSVKGGWVSESVFEINFQFIGHSLSTVKDFTFTPDGVDVRMTNYKDGSVVTLHAGLQGR